MAVNKSKMHFRNERARELERVAKVLEKHLGSDVTTAPLYNAISDLSDENKIPALIDGSRHENIWGYDIEDFEMNLQTLKHVKPSGIEKGRVYLNLKLRAEIDSWTKMNDPLIELSFRVHIKGIADKPYHFGFHIDRHKTTAQTEEPHPMYHLQYNINPNNSENFNTGEVLYIDTPRLLHCPLDFILGVGFLTSNFFPTAFAILSEDREYNNISKTYQEKIWKPYYHTLANHWRPFDQGMVTWNPITDICPVLL